MKYLVELEGNVISSPLHLNQNSLSFQKVCVCVCIPLLSSFKEEEADVNNFHFANEEIQTQ